MTNSAGQPPTVAADTDASGIGKIERVPLRMVWKHEARGLTNWLQENIDVLNDVLPDLALSNVEREQAAGAFNADLVAEDESGRPVVVENQPERSNHGHLGKVITYVSNLEASAAIWIVSDPRPEHIRAISWLNQSGLAGFYLLKIEGIRIGGSPPAPLLTLIVGPSPETLEAGETKKDLSERHQLRRRYWTALLDRAKKKTRLHAALSPGNYTWLGTGAGRSGLFFNYTVLQHGTGVELYIDRGQDAEAENRRIFDRLRRSKEDIETDFGSPLEWQPLEDRRACRIRRRFNTGGYRDEEKWETIQDTTIDAMIRLEKAFKPRIAQIKL